MRVDLTAEGTLAETITGRNGKSQRQKKEEKKKQKEETKAKAAWPSVLSWKFNLCIDTTQPQPGEYAHSGLAWL